MYWHEGPDMFGQHCAAKRIITLFILIGLAAGSLIQPKLSVAEAATPPETQNRLFLASTATTNNVKQVLALNVSNQNFSSPNANAQINFLNINYVKNVSKTPVDVNNRVPSRLRTKARTSVYRKKSEFIIVSKTRNASSGIVIVEDIDYREDLIPETRKKPPPAQTNTGDDHSLEPKKYSFPSNLKLKPPPGPWKGTYQQLRNGYFECSIESEDFQIPYCPTWSYATYANVHPSLIHWNLPGPSKCVSRTSVKLLEQDLQEAQNVLEFTLRCRTGSDSEDVDVTITPVQKMSCNSSGDCARNFDRNSRCLFSSKSGLCSCNYGYSLKNGYYCKINSSSEKKPNVALKAVMAGVACFVLAVIAVCAMPLIRRVTTHGSRRRHSPAEDTQRRGSDVFLISDELAQMRLVDKPPTYQEVLRNDRMQRGIPPPAYPGSQGSSALGTATPGSSAEERNNNNVLSEFSGDAGQPGGGESSRPSGNTYASSAVAESAHQLSSSVVGLINTSDVCPGTRDQLTTCTQNVQQPTENVGSGLVNLVPDSETESFRELGSIEDAGDRGGTSYLNQAFDSDV